MKDMQTMNATDVRKDWSTIMDSVSRKRPLFIKRTRDYMMLASKEDVSTMLSYLKYQVREEVEPDGSITLTTDDMDLIVNAKTEEAAKKLMAEEISEYAEEYFDCYELYHNAPNRRAHFPFVMKALIANSIEEVEEAIVCHAGKN